jgi:C4-dicarboxylate-specific signal transduction histidine kinase
VVRDVLRLMRSELMNLGVEIDAQLADAWPIHGDRVQLQQVLLNLVMNACDAMSSLQASERRLGIRSEIRDGCVWIEVADNGPGIPPETLERLFEPFFTTKARGMGLGLTVCSTIVRSHGGEIRAANRPGRGAIISFSIPVHPDVVDEEQ